MKYKIIAMFLLVLFFMTGCSYNQTGIEALLKPPKLSEEQKNIYDALVSSVGKNITLKYPRKGDFTSAFLFYNIDSDSMDEAIVFYSKINSAGASSIRLNILDHSSDGKWVSAYDASGVVNASEIEKVSFVVVNQQTYMAVGFNLTGTTEKSILLYSYEDGKLKNNTRINCTNYEICDLNDDKLSEIITISDKIYINGVKTVIAEFRRITDSGESHVISTTQMDPDVDEYNNIVCGILKDGRSALYLDGIRGTDVYTTEILACQGEQIKNFIYNTDENNNLIEDTRRDYGAPSIDLNGDQIVEIPVSIPALGYENMEIQQQENFTKWYIYDSGDLRLRRTTYVAYPLGYVFAIPNEWVDRVTVEFVSSDNEVIFYEYNDEDTDKKKLLSIKVIKRSDYEKEIKNKGFSLLQDNGQIIYTYQIYEYGSALTITSEEVFTNFQLYKS